MAAFPFDVVAFDLDGTLADTAPDLAAALNHALAALGRPAVPPESVRHLIGHGARALLRRGLAASGEAPEALVEQGYPIFLEHYGAHICDGTAALSAGIERGARRDRGGGGGARRLHQQAGGADPEAARRARLARPVRGRRRRRHAAGPQARSRRLCSRRSPAPAAAGPPSSAIRSPTPTRRGRRECRSSRSASAFPTGRSRRWAPTR